MTNFLLLLIQQQQQQQQHTNKAVNKATPADPAIIMVIEKSFAKSISELINL